VNVKFRFLYSVVHLNFPCVISISGSELVQCGSVVLGLESVCLGLAVFFYATNFTGHKPSHLLVFSVSPPQRFVLMLPRSGTSLSSLVIFSLLRSAPAWVFRSLRH
jgi:hypothetical protein